MTDNKRDPFVDELLDATLARLRSPEPPPGMAERILESLRAGERPAARFGWRWLPVLASAGALLVVAAVAYLAYRPAPAPPVVVQAPQPPAAAPSAAVELPGPASVPRPRPRAAPLPQRAQTQVRGALPRRERFPTPVALSEQEQLLLRYVSLAPEEVLLALHVPAGPLEELRIEPLHIAPLVVEERSATKGDEE